MTSSNTPRQSISLMPGSSSRPSTSSLAGPNYSQGIGYSPPTPASPGIPSFRSLRSFLPFGPNKNANNTTSSPNNLSRSPFGAFGSVRRSITKDRDRKASLSNDAVVSPVIAVEQLNDNSSPDDSAVIRRSVSLSNIDKPLPSDPSCSSTFGDDLLPSRYTVRTPSPIGPLSAELSTIIEADNSGMSKHIVAKSSLAAVNSNTKSTQGHGSSTQGCDIDASAMDLSTTDLADQVREAIREGDSLKDQWLNADKTIIIIDGDEHPDVAESTFNLDSVDRDLAELLSPHSTAQTSSTSNNAPSNPTTPNSVPSPSRLPRARQASSFLTRLRSFNTSSSPQSPTIHHPATATPATPKPLSSNIVDGNNYNALKSSSSPALTSTSTSSPTASRRTSRLFGSSTGAAKVFGKQNGSTPQQVMLSVRTDEGTTHNPTSSPSPKITLRQSSLDSRRSTTENVTSAGIGLGRPMSRGTSFDSRITRPDFNRSPTSPASTETTPTETNAKAKEEQTNSPPNIPFHEYRPSLDSNITARPSFDGIIISRPNSPAGPLRDRDGRRTPSTMVMDRASPIPRIPDPPVRMRKRSMSVQDRFARSRNEDIPRSGSSLSTYGTKPGRGSSSSGGGGPENGISVNESGASSGPKMEWLGPRAAKAFRAAGLLDPIDREKERGREDGGESTRRLRDRSSSTSGVLSPSPLGSSGGPASALNRFGSLRSASEYNPTYVRSHSRLTLSEAGSGALPRRGSECFSAYGGGSSHGGNGGAGGSSYGHNKLMESPTFTVSSGRETPKSSVSTAPTSLADSFGYLGRDRSERDSMTREREREREEMREMKERHGTEMGALLGALSDSQRLVRMLREENSDLRDRLERFTVAVQANQELRQVCGDLQSECESLRKENLDLRKEAVGLRGLANTCGGGNGSGSRTPVPKAASSSSPLARPFTFTSRMAHKGYDDTFIDHGSEVENHHSHYLSSKDSSDITTTILPPSSPVSSKKRRLSNSSSIFPIPPSNMTLLLNEDATSTLGSIASCSVGDHSQYGFSFSPPRQKPHVQSPSSQSTARNPLISYPNFTGNNIPSTSSSQTISSIPDPSPMANFSMVTTIPGSPGSLFLRPEHEILLGDMESLDLGVRSGGEGNDEDRKVDGW